jgi:O-methyltransferase involved in polyketide biosynthesis
MYLSDEEVKAALNACRQHLGRDGRIAFETRNPAVEERKSWTRHIQHAAFHAAARSLGDASGMWF